MSSIRGTKKSEREKIILHPIFIRFIPYTLDTFWHEVFTAYAHGQFPKDLTYKQNLLSHRKRNDVKHCEIDETNVKQSYLAVKDFMRNVVRLYSPLDTQIEDEKMQDEGEGALPASKSSFSEIKQTFAKQMLITDFIERKVQKYSLNEKTARDLRSLINFGFLLKVILPKNVVFKHGQIVSISGLKYSKKSEKFKLDLGDLDKSAKKPKAKAKKKTTTLWEGYVKKLKGEIKCIQKLSK